MNSSRSPHSAQGAARRPSSLATQAGFTVIELLIAVVIIGILTALLTPQVGRALERRSVSAAAGAVSTLHARARSTALHRSMPVALVLRSNRAILLSRHPVTGVVDTLDDQDLNVRYGVALTSTPDSLVFDARGIGVGTASALITIRRAGAADSIQITAVGRIMP